MARGGLQVDEDHALERRTFIVQRTSWAVLTLALAAALAGAFGRGPLAHGTAASPDGAVSVRYERLARAHTPAEITVRVARRALDADGAAEVWIDRAYLERVEVVSLMPQPDRQRSGPGGVVLRVTPPAGEGDAVLLVRVKHQGPGAARLRLGVGGAHDEARDPARSVEAPQFVYP